jgi:amino acid transporter
LGNQKDSLKTGYGFGTFKGVFTPSILTILGVVMYLRFGWVLGNVGLVWTLVIVTIATMVTFFTALSFSALATNMKVGGGGAYFIISRSLGLETGAAIGVPLYFAQAVGISFYIAGFAESVIQVLKDWAPESVNYISSIFGNPAVAIGVTALIILAILASASASLALKTQFIILALIVASLVVFFMGSSSGIDEIKNITNNTNSVTPTGLFHFPNNFWIVFAVFFPAVTGIEAGLAMSGDLKDPAKSLPRGTLAAIGLSYLIYIAIPVFLGYLIPYATEQGKALLTEDSLIMCRIAGGKLGSIVLFAIWGASLSSAMGALLGAPRTLQALAKDGILPQFIGRGYGKGNDPRIATAITFTLAFLGIVLGDLNLIAPVLSMFFLTSYCTINIASGVESLISSPSWRPTFKTPWFISIAGALLCIFIMIKIDFTASIIALLVTSIIYYVVKRRKLMAAWGDARYGLMMMFVRHFLYKLDIKQADEKNWMPNIIVLSGAPTSRWELVELGNAITGKQGFLTVAAVVNETQSAASRIKTIEETMRNYLTKKNITALVKVLRSDAPLEGAMELIESYSFGPLVPNTVLLGITEKKENFHKFAKMIKLVKDSGRNIIILREGEEIIQKSDTIKRIIIWWGGRTNNGALMLALAYLMKKSQTWCNAEIVLKTIIFDTNEREQAENKLNSFIKSSRLNMTGEVITSTNNKLFITLRNHSAEADLVFLGIRAPKDGETDDEYSLYYEELLDKTKDFPMIIKTLAAENIEFQRIFKS